MSPDAVTVPVNVGAVKVLFVRVSVDEVVTMFTPSIVTTPAEDLAIVVSVACPNSIEPRPNAEVVDDVIPLTGRPVAFVRVPLVGVPSAPLNNTGAPAEPVLIARAVAMPVPSPEIPVDTGNPVTFVITPDAGVPSAGVVSVGLVKVLFVRV